MMSRIGELFQRKTQRILNIYITAGFPETDSLEKILPALARNGADMIEIGIPYSDPLADGPIIQRSSATALANGMTLELLFDQLKDLRVPASGLGEIPIVLMGYMNPVLQFGFEKFCSMAAAAGIDGLILPDMPVHEFENRYGKIIGEHGLDFIFLITPSTPEDRVRKLDDLSSGFLYAVSSSSTTGAADFKADNSNLSRLKELRLRNPVLVGFGIKTPGDFDRVSSFANGAIIGSEFIRQFETGKDEEKVVKDFLKPFLIRTS